MNGSKICFYFVCSLLFCHLIKTIEAAKFVDWIHELESHFECVRKISSSIFQHQLNANNCKFSGCFRNVTIAQIIQCCCETVDWTELIATNWYCKQWNKFILLEYAMSQIRSIYFFFLFGLTVARKSIMSAGRILHTCQIVLCRIIYWKICIYNRNCRCLRDFDLSPVERWAAQIEWWLNTNNPYRYKMKNVR